MDVSQREKLVGICPHENNLAACVICDKEKQKDAFSEKQHQWGIISDEVNAITDKLEKGIDMGIKDGVISLRALKFSTRQSCAGHVNEIEGEGYQPPWIELCVPEPAGWKGDKAKQQRWTEENQKQRDRLTPLLEEFNSGRNVEPDTRLHFSKIGIFGGFRIQSTGAESLPSLSQPEYTEKIFIYQKEMQAFIEFLKTKFFNNLK